MFVNGSEKGPQNFKKNGYGTQNRRTGYEAVVDPKSASREKVCNNIPRYIKP